MIVACTSRVVKNGLEYELVVGKEYLVTGISFIPSNSQDTQVLYEIVNDAGNLRPVPSTLFKVIDDRCSKYWIAKAKDSGTFSIRPKEFFRKYFHDDLSNGVGEIVAIYDDVVKKMMAESSK